MRSRPPDKPGNRAEAADDRKRAEHTIKGPFLVVEFNPFPKRPVTAPAKARLKVLRRQRRRMSLGKFSWLYSAGLATTGALILLGNGLGVSIQPTTGNSTRKWKKYPEGPDPAEDQRQAFRQLSAAPRQQHAIRQENHKPTP